MFGKIMVATDDTPLMENAIRYAALLFPDSEFHAFSVIDTKQKVVPMTDLIKTEAHNLATCAVDNAEKVLNDNNIKNVTKCIHSGDPSHEILNHIDENRIELLVMTETSKAGSQRLQIGRTCERVLELVRCPVLLIGRETELKVPNHILNPTTGSKYSENGTELALTMAEHFKAEVTTLFIGSGDGSHTLEYTGLLAEKLGVKVNGAKASGSANRSILKYSEHTDILIGSRGRGGLKYKLRFLHPDFALGALEREIMVESPHPLLLVGD